MVKVASFLSVQNVDLSLYILMQRLGKQKILSLILHRKINTSNKVSSLIILIFLVSPLFLLILFLNTIPLPHRFSSNKAPPSINSDRYHHE